MTNLQKIKLLEDKIAALEQRIQMLEARPIMPYTFPVPNYPSPYWWNAPVIVTNQSSTAPLNPVGVDIDDLFPVGEFRDA